MKHKKARANVPGLRQQTQYTCMATSLTAAFKAYGKEVSETDVNKVLGAAAKRGARWEEVLNTCQYFGMRGTLVVPATLGMLKTWTDAGIPVLIAWNPEDRPWSHASVVIEVDESENIHIMDPNIPDPDEFFRVVPKSDFYKKWGEDWGDFIVRRPALAITREIDESGRQVLAAAKVPVGNYDFGSLSHRRDYGDVEQGDGASKLPINEKEPQAQLPSAGEKEEPDKGRVLGPRLSDSDDIYRNTEASMSSHKPMSTNEFLRRMTARYSEGEDVPLKDLPKKLQENADEVEEEAEEKEKSKKCASMDFTQKVASFYRAAEELRAAQDQLRQQYKTSSRFELERLLFSDAFPFDVPLREVCASIKDWKDDLED